MARARAWAAILRPMQTRKSSGVFRVMHGNRECPESLTGKTTAEFTCHRPGPREFAKTKLGGDLPRRCSADKDGVSVIFDGAMGFSRQT